MNKYLYLIKNIGLLTLSNFATKMLSFFLVPLYTNVLTTTEYGTYDLFYTTINVLIPILTLNIQESVLRFSLEKNNDRDAIVTIAIKYFLFSCGIVLIVLLVHDVFDNNAMGKKYAVFFFFMFFSQAISGIILAYTRGIDKISELSLSSVVGSVVTIVCNILFLVYFKWGLDGYFLANIIGPTMQSFILLFPTHCLKKIHLRKKYSQEKKEMLNYSRPMIANSIAWWINNASDRYIVTFFCGLAENGIYSVASKIPSILNIVQIIFNQAWVLSAVKDFDPEDKNGFFSNTYKAYNCIMVILCSAIIVADKILASILYANNFYVAWKYVPWLTIAIVFGALSGYIGGVFSAVKDSKIFAQSTVVGAVLNIFMNVVFTPLIGTLGAAIATAISYFVVWSMRYWYSRRYIIMKINLYRDLITYALLIIQSLVILFISKSSQLYGIEVILFGLIILLYMKELLQTINIIYKKFVRKKNEF